MMHTKRNLVAAVFCLTAFLLPAILPAQVSFRRTFGGAANDEGLSVKQTDDGGYIVAGSTSSYGAGSWDFLLVRTDSLGDTLWTRTFGDTSEEHAASVALAEDGGFVVAGYDYPTPPLSIPDIFVVRTDADGDTVWTRKYGGDSADIANSVDRTTGGGFILAGLTRSFGTGSTDMYVIRIDGNGETLWTRTYGGAHDDGAEAVRQTADGGYILAGWTHSLGAGAADVWLVKIDSAGDVAWTRTFGGDTTDVGYSVAPAKHGGYAIVGSTKSWGAQVEDIYLVVTDSVGEVVFQRMFGGSDWDCAKSVEPTADSGYIIAGFADPQGQGSLDAYLVKTDSMGYAVWSQTYGGTDDDRGHCVTLTADGGYAVAGYMWVHGFGTQALLVKTDSLGNVGIEEPGAPPTRAPALSLACAPNPFSGSTTVSLSPSFPLPLAPVLRIYDSQGRMVLSRKISTSPFLLSTSGLPSGAYFLRLDAAGAHATTRVVLRR